mgnify:CR=1 FL=1
MKKGLSATNKRMKSSKSFNPNHDFLDQAVQDFLKEGGKITKIVDVEDDDLERFMAYSRILVNDLSCFSDIGPNKREG